jgi:hypothetical protein
VQALRLLVGVVLVASVAPGTASAAEIHVPADASTLQVAIGQARPGDTIVLASGTYPGGNVVPKGKHDLRIVGEDRSGVMLDGGGRRKNGIEVHADGVSILNMSAHGFLENAFYWEDADRFRASYLTVWNVRGYGIYTEDSSRGVIDHDYVSGAADAAYYVGECRPCRATISHVTATLSAVGYSGTNATGVVIRDSVWDRNGAGLVPNTFANEALPPQARTTIVGNTITGSGRARVPIHTALAPFVGIGIAIAGGNDNVVRGNRITSSERYGIAVFPTARYVTFDPSVRRDPGPPWRPHGNRIVGNTVSGSGRADLALSLGSASGNCFAGNTAAGRLPPGLSGCGSTGDASVAAALTAPLHVMFDATIRRRRPPSYLSMPLPPAKPEMPAGGQRS